MAKLIKAEDRPLAPVTYPRDRDPALVYLASLAPSGRRAMATRLRQAAAMLLPSEPRRERQGFFLTIPWHELRFQHVAALRTALQERGQAPATVNLTLYALRGVARAAFNLELMTADDYQRIRDVKPLRGERLPSGRALSSGEIAAMMEACAGDEGPAGVRDAALIALLYAGGLRRAEIVALNVEDYNPQTGELVVRGKGGKERLLYVDNGPADALADWLLLRGDQPGALFVPIDKGGRIFRRPMTDQAVYGMLRKRAVQAGVKEFSPHDLRRSFVSDLLDAGADISVVQRLAGHANVQTTARYDRRGEEAKRKAVGLLHVPYRRRQRTAAVSDERSANG